uniref:Uncharacterized protein n=1 Tax=Solanum tuberosum TaxID=4113 RepID=M1DYA7_SOLTU
MTTINRAWYTREDQVSTLTFKLTKEQIEKDQERDQNMAKIFTQLDILSKNVRGAGARGVNVEGVGCANPVEAKFEALYNEEVNFLANQGGGYRSNYPRRGGNQGWSNDKGVVGLNLGSWVESRHIGSFGELGRARRTTRWIDVSQATSSRVLFIGDMNTRRTPARRVEDEMVNEGVPPQGPQGDQVPRGYEVLVDPSTMLF